MKLSRLVHWRRLLFIYSCKFRKGRYTLGHKLQQQVAARDNSVCTGPATSCSSTLRRHIASSVLGKFVKIFVSATEFCRRDKSHKFCPIWFFATCCCDKILLQRERLSQKLSSTHGAMCRRNMLLQLVAGPVQTRGDLSPQHVSATCRLVCTDLRVRKKIIWIRFHRGSCPRIAIQYERLPRRAEGDPL